MGDIDILVPGGDVESVESRLLRNGMVRDPIQKRPAGAHHGVPLCHSQHHVWVEVHSALFPKYSVLGNDVLFEPAQIAARSVSSTFQGRRVHRLSDELQLAYIASSWVRDLSSTEIHPSFVLSLLDAVYLLGSPAHSFDWEKLVVNLEESELAAASVYLMLAYLCRHELAACDARVLSRIASGQRIVGAWERWIIEMLLDSHLVGGGLLAPVVSRWTTLIVLNTLLERGSRLRKLFALPWNIVFPPFLQDRYTIGFHGRRFARLLGRRPTR
jgi:hypothetical protein